MERRDLEDAIPQFQMLWSKFDPSGSGTLPPKHFFDVRKTTSSLLAESFLSVIVAPKHFFSVAPCMSVNLLKTEPLSDTLYFERFAKERRLWGVARRTSKFLRLS